MNLQIGKVINSLLSGNVDLVAIVGDKIYPLIAETETTYPFIIYKRTEVKPEYTKDYHTQDRLTVEIMAASSTYAESVEIADLIRDSIDNKVGIHNEIDIKSMRLVGTYEDIIEDAYVQDLTFEILI
jgi:hypothetical protein